MKRNAMLSALFLLTCSTVVADDRWRISILASELSAGGNQPSANETHAGVAVGVAYAPAPQWDAELTVATQSHVSPYQRLFYFPMPDGSPGSILPVTEYRRYRVMPFDLSITRHFLADQPIAPYVRAGIRHVQSPRDPAPATYIYGPTTTVQQVSEGFGLSDRTSAQAGAGVRLRLTPRTALRGEVTRLLRSDGADFDPLTRFAVGVSWLF